MKRALLPIVAALVLGACESSAMYSRADASPAEDADFVRGPAPLRAVEFDALWARAEWVLTMEGASLDSDRTRYERREMVTHWDTQLAPNRYEGRRSRAWVRFEPLGPGEWNVAVAVQVQRNADIDQPSAAAQAKWEDTTPNAARANVLVWKIESAFREAGSDEGGAAK